MAALPIDAQPGEKWVYGYSHRYSRRGRRARERQAARRIPAHEHHRAARHADTAFYLPTDKQDRLTAVYSATDSGKLERAPIPGGMIGPGRLCRRARAQSFSGGAGLAVDGRRLRPLPADDAQRRRAGRQATAVTQERRADDRPITCAAFSSAPGSGLGLGFSVVKDVGARGDPGSRRRVRLGRRVSLDVLGATRASSSSWCISRSSIRRWGSTTSASCAR